MQESPSTMWIPREIRLKSLDLEEGSITLSAFEMVVPSQQCVKEGKRLSKQSDTEGGDVQSKRAGRAGSRENKQN